MSLELKVEFLQLEESDAGDARRFLFSIIYVCKSIVFFYILGPNSLLGYYYFNLEAKLFS